MNSSTILKIRLPAKVKKSFDKLAKMKNCTKSYLAGEAILDYAARQAAGKINKVERS